MLEVNYKEGLLSEELLNNVAGGTMRETADDTRFLNSLNGSTDRFGEFKCFWIGEPIMKMVDEAWAKLGIESYVYTGSNDNIYRYKGKYISQEQARQIAMDITGHHMTTKDWKW